ncbi:MAG: class I SAM-dependent methyltransferase [Chthoniobacterales bacterium]
MTSQPSFDEDLLLEEPNRSSRLIREFYEQYGEPRNYEGRGGQHEAIKAAFFQQRLDAFRHGEKSLGLDVGCRGGALIGQVGRVRWSGVDINPEGLKVARESGVPCAEMDFTAGIAVRDDSFDVLMMTEVLEHLPYPSITVREVHRILKKKPASLFFGSVPLDYHLHRRWKVLRGKRLSGEQTHVHHFSFAELDRLLRFYFEQVEYLPLSGTAQRHPRLPLSYNLFVRDIAWAAAAPKTDVGRWDVRPARS